MVSTSAPFVKSSAGIREALMPGAVILRLPRVILE
jgi:hypothetical protein